MKYLLAFLSVCIFQTFAIAAQNDLSDYRNDATKLYKQLENKDATDLEANAKALVNSSKAIVTQSIKALPQCDEYLTALLQVADKIATLPLEEIEKGYHADGKLPPLKDGSCYHAKDLLVHPATVQAMARIGIKTKKEWKQAEHEIEEVLEHLTLVESVYAQK